MRTYRKERGLPPDRWELVGRDSVASFRGEYFSVVNERCDVAEYLVGALNESGQETADSSMFRLLWVLEPKLPLVSTQAGKLRFDVDGFVGCGTAGQGFEVTRWELLRKTSATAATEVFLIDPNVGWVLSDKPGQGQVWAYAVRGQVQDLYATSDPNAPALVTPLMSQDLCAVRGPSSPTTRSARTSTAARVCLRRPLPLRPPRPRTGAARARGGAGGTSSTPPTCGRTTS